MRLSIKTCTLDMPFAAMLDFCVAQGVQAVEIGTGNWSGAPHIDLDELLGSETARQRWMDQLRRRDIALCALNCSGNPLAFQKDWEVTEKTFRLAGLLGVEKIVMMSGLPAGCPGDKTPVWITTSWPPETQDILDYQWNEVAIPKWKELVRMAEDCGIRQIALENHGMQLVYNPETLFWPLRRKDWWNPACKMWKFPATVVMKQEYDEGKRRFLIAMDENITEPLF